VRIAAVSLAVVFAACARPASADPAGDAPERRATPAPIATDRPVTAIPAGWDQPEILSGSVSVEAGDHFFMPQLLTVRVGTTVTWKVVGQSAHDATATDMSFASSNLYFGGTYAFTFGTAGRFPYVCTQHIGDGMVGEVIVVPK
jgi:plastocyanin